MSWNAFLSQCSEIPAVLKKIVQHHPTRIWVDDKSALHPQERESYLTQLANFSFFSGARVGWGPWEQIHRNPISLIWTDQNITLNDPVIKIIQGHPAILVVDVTVPPDPAQIEILHSLFSFAYALVLIANDADRNRLHVPASLSDAYAVISRNGYLTDADLAQELLLKLHRLAGKLSSSFLRKHHGHQATRISTRFDAASVTSALLAQRLDQNEFFSKRQSPTQKLLPKAAIGTLFYELSDFDRQGFADSLNRAIAQLPPGNSLRLYWASHDGKDYDPFGGLEKSPALEVVRVISEGNPGFGTGMNRLMKKAFADGAEVFIGVNPDGMMHPDFLRELLDFALAHPRALIEARQFPDEHPKVYDPITYRTPWVAGSCFLVPKAVFSTTGGFDENIFMYCEDVDLSWSARLAGLETLFCPQALFFHQPLNTSENSLKQSLISARYLGEKWGDREFSDWCAAELREKCGVAVAELPPLPKPPAVDREAARGIADFDHELSFAEVRWKTSL